jgi:broad specificity phosphatase PhoE
MSGYILSKEIYLFRHGETDWNKQHKRQGCEFDIELNTNGEKQAILAGNYLHNYRINDKPFDLIISSGMIRANKTAEIIAEKINYKNSIHIIKNLKEKCHGTLSGLSNDKIKSDPKFKKYNELNNELKKEKDPIKKIELQYDFNIIFNKLYNEELYSKFRHRAKKALLEIYNRKEEKIIVISHSATIQQILQIITNIDDYIPMPHNSNCQMSYIQVFTKIINNKIKRKIKIIKLSTTAHIRTY